jgi:5-methylcytosine-specific restriction enzyme A
VTSLRRCLEPGYQALSRASRCQDHQNRKWASATSVMGPGWSARRARILKRDRYRCVICGSRLQISVDHVTPRSEGGGDQDWNLRVLCNRHHNEKTANEGHEAARRKRMAGSRRVAG